MFGFNYEFEIPCGIREQHAIGVTRGLRFRTELLERYVTEKDDRMYILTPKGLYVFQPPTEQFINAGRHIEHDLLTPT
jgi:hypothetical protein